MRSGDISVFHAIAAIGLILTVLILYMSVIPLTVGAAHSAIVFGYSVKSIKHHGAKAGGTINFQACCKQGYT